MRAALSERGFSLLELLAAACIVLLVLVFLVNGISSSFRALISSREQSALADALRAAAEEARAEGYAALHAGTHVTAEYLPGYDLVRTVSYVNQMADSRGNPVVKHVQVSLHRTPVADHPTPLVATGFLLYEGGR